MFFFYYNLNKNIEENIIGKENRIIIGGDFNVTLNPEWDCSGGEPVKEKPQTNMLKIYAWIRFDRYLAYNKPRGETFYSETKEISYSEKTSLLVSKAWFTLAT